MLLVNEDSKPNETVYYTACCAFNVLKKSDGMSVDELYASLVKLYNETLDYATLLLGIDFLYLVNKVEIKNEKIKCI